MNKIQKLLLLTIGAISGNMLQTVTCAEKPALPPGPGRAGRGELRVAIFASEENGNLDHGGWIYVKVPSDEITAGELMDRMRHARNPTNLSMLMRLGSKDPISFAQAAGSRLHKDEIIRQGDKIGGILEEVEEDPFEDPYLNAFLAEEEDRALAVARAKMDDRMHRPFISHREKKGRDRAQEAWEAGLRFASLIGEGDLPTTPPAPSITGTLSLKWVPRQREGQEQQKPKEDMAAAIIKALESQPYTRNVTTAGEIKERLNAALPLRVKAKALVSKGRALPDDEVLTEDMVNGPIMVVTEELPAPSASEE